MRKLNALLLILFLIFPSLSFGSGWALQLAINTAVDATTTSAVAFPDAIRSGHKIVNSMVVSCGTIVAGTIAVQVSSDGSTFYDFYYLAGAAAQPAQWITTSGTGGASFQLPKEVSAWDYIRFKTGGTQTDNVVFTVQGN
jgi:hypothetical protein